MIVAIRKVLDDRLASFWTGEVAWEGIRYAPTQGVPYLEARMAAFATMAAGVGADAPKQHTGAYQISVWQPLSAGLRSALATAEALTTHFKRGTPMPLEGGGALSIVNVSARPALISPDWATVPVLVEWYALQTG